MGSSGLNNYKLFGFSFLLGSGLWGTSFIFAARVEILAVFIDNYTFLGGILVAVFLLYLSLQMPKRESAKEWKMKFWGLLPCPFCMLALALTVVLLVPEGGSLLNWSLAVAAVFFS